MSGVDLPRSGPCRRGGCRRRAVRAGVCIDHWQELNGTGYGPWPDDVEPVGWRDRYLQRTGTTYQDREAARMRRRRERIRRTGSASVTG